MFDDLARALTSPEAMLALCDEPTVFGAKKQAQVAYDLWSGAEHRFVGEYRGIQVPVGTGTGLVLRLFWDSSTVTPDLGGLMSAIRSDLPIEMIRADEKATWKGRDKKQGVFFTWQGMSQRPLSQWFAQRFGVSACVTQLFNASDIDQNIAIVAVKDGIDHLWTATASS